MKIEKNISDSQNLPIGVFDSGIGGLTVLKALRQKFPYEDFLYVGDTARLPYGTKSPQTVIRYAEGVTRKILEYGVKALVIACNTASTHALASVQTLVGSHIPVIGMIEPTVIQAIQQTRNGHIAVMATYGTVKSSIYQTRIHHHHPDCRVTSIACQILVALAEEGWSDGRIAQSTLEEYILPTMRDANPPDTIILGCTHFPVFAPVLQEIVGNHVTLINSGECAAHSITNSMPLRENRHRNGISKFLATDDIERFAAQARKFYDRDILPEDICLIDIKL
jgi:glutamate racemase